MSHFSLTESSFLNSSNSSVTSHSILLNFLAIKSLSSSGIFSRITVINIVPKVDKQSGFKTSRFLI